MIERVSKLSDNVEVSRADFDAKNQEKGEEKEGTDVEKETK